MNSDLKHLKRIFGSAFVVIILLAVACRVSDVSRPVVSQLEKPIEIRENTMRSVSEYAGSGVCLRCHDRIYAKWQKTAHAGGLMNEDYVDPPHQGSCVRCHSTQSVENRVGCEACHGPRASHAQKPVAGDATDCRICIVQKKCIQCHNRTIDPDFNVQNDWKIVDHGKDTRESLP